MAHERYGGSWSDPSHHLTFWSPSFTFHVVYFWLRIDGRRGLKLRHNGRFDGTTACVQSPRSLEKKTMATTCRCCTCTVFYCAAAVVARPSLDRNLSSGFLPGPGVAMAARAWPLSRGRQPHTELCRSPSRFVCSTPLRCVGCQHMGGAGESTGVGGVKAPHEPHRVVEHYIEREQFPTSNCFPTVPLRLRDFDDGDHHHQDLPRPPQNPAPQVKLGSPKRKHPRPTRRKQSLSSATVVDATWGEHEAEGKKSYGCLQLSATVMKSASSHNLNRSSDLIIS